MPRKLHPFWRFSLRVYGRTGVERACLVMQEAGADVNLLLFCCWQGLEGISLSKTALRKAIHSVVAWQQQVVQPLRQARRSSKLGRSGLPEELGTALSKQVAKLELEAEYLEQLVLFRQATAAARGKRTQDPEIIAAGNLERYLELLGIPLPAALKRQVKVLLSASG